MAQNYTWPSVSVTASNPSIGTNGSPAPLQSTVVAGQDPSNNTSPLQTDVSGNLLVSVAASAAPLDVNATIVSPLASGRVVVDGSQVTQPVSAASLPLPTGAATAANQATEIASLASIDSKLTAPLSVTGPLTDTQLRASPVPVSAASLPLPTGAATEATLSALNTKVPSGLTVSSTRLLIDGSGVTQPISAASLPLPTGAATEATLSALNAKFNSLGQKNMAGSAPVVIASDQSTLAVAFGGKSKANAPVVTDYSSTNVTSAAYVQIVASTSSDINLIELFDSSGQAIYLAVGAAASEVNQLVIIPGGNGQVPLFIPAGSRISYKAVSTSATSGINILNMYS